jgi:hypothetical protein
MKRAVLLDISHPNAGESLPAEKEQARAEAMIRQADKKYKGVEGILTSRLQKVESLKPQALQGLEEIYNLCCSRLKVEPQKPGLTKEEIRLDALIPVKTEKMGGIVDYWENMDKMIKKAKYSPPPAIAEADFELRNFIDGKRSIREIRNAASAEYGPLPLADVEGFMKYLEKLGMVEIKKR